MCATRGQHVHTAVEGPSERPASNAPLDHKKSKGNKRTVYQKPQRLQPLREAKLKFINFSTMESQQQNLQVQNNELQEQMRKMKEQMEQMQKNYQTIIQQQQDQLEQNQLKTQNALEEIEKQRRALEAEKLKNDERARVIAQREEAARLNEENTRRAAARQNEEEAAEARQKEEEARIAELRKRAQEAAEAAKSAAAAAAEAAAQLRSAQTTPSRRSESPPMRTANASAPEVGAAACSTAPIYMFSASPAPSMSGSTTHVPPGFAPRITEQPPSVEAVRATNSVPFIFAADSIPKFDGESQTQPVGRWLAKVNDEAAFHGWSEAETFAAAKRALRGVAETWLQGNLGIHSWRALQQGLMAAFGRRINEFDVHETLKAKKKKPEESNIKFIQEMRFIGAQGGLNDNAIKEHIIRGLTNVISLRKELRKAQDIPQMLEMLDQHERDMKECNPKKSFEQHNREKKKDGCFKCGQKGHIARRCPQIDGKEDDRQEKAPRITCSFCHRPNHRAEACRFRLNKASATGAGGPVTAPKVRSVAEDHEEQGNHS